MAVTKWRALLKKAGLAQVLLSLFCRKKTSWLSASGAMTYGYCSCSVAVFDAFNSFRCRLIWQLNSVCSGMNLDYTFDSFPLALCVCVCMRSGCWWGFALTGRNTLYWNWHAVTFHQRLERPPPLNSVCERCSFYECNSAVSLVPEEKSDLSLSAQHNRESHTNILLGKNCCLQRLILGLGDME